MALLEKVRIGDLLLQQDIITQDQLAFALEQQKRSGRRLGCELVENLFVSEERICEAIAWQFDIPYINLNFFSIDAELMRVLPKNMALQFHAIVLEERDGRLLVGMADPTDLLAYDEISIILGRDFDVAVVAVGQLLEKIKYN